jgi:hypothetical protein
VLLHWDVYASGDEYEEEFMSEDDIPPVVCCRKENIESFGTAKKERTAAEWREHHADYFAAAIAMPNATFKPFVSSLMRENGIYTRVIKLDGGDDVDNDLEIFANDILPDAISEVYGVSRRAAKIKLKQTGFVS